MHEDDENRIAAHLAKTMAMMCVRNTELENIHAGLTPVTRTGDYSDINGHRCGRARNPMAGSLALR